MNYTTIAGHLGADPETRFTSNGQKVTTLRVACKSRKDETIWVKVTIWGDQFDKMLTYFKKGSPIIVVGELLKPEIFNDREGKPQVSIQIVAYHISFSPFGKSKQEEGQQNSGFGNNNYQARNEQSSQFDVGAAPVGGGYTEFSDEEIPF